MRDIGLVKYDEPYQRLFNQGTIIAQKAKMSKSRGNVITPDTYVDALGADVVRTYLMFLGPWDQGGEWSDAGINGMARWLNRVWELTQKNTVHLSDSTELSKIDRDMLRVTNKTVKRVAEDLDKFKFNTAIAALMEMSNYMGKVYEESSLGIKVWEDAIEKLLLLLAPVAPHITEELWERSGHSYSIHNHLIPDWDEGLAQDEEITLVVQINGKLRDRIQVPSGLNESDAENAARASEKVIPYLDGKTVQQFIYVPERLVNFVVN